MSLRFTYCTYVQCSVYCTPIVFFFESETCEENEDILDCVYVLLLSSGSAGARPRRPQRARRRGHDTRDVRMSSRPPRTLATAAAPRGACRRATLRDGPQRPLRSALRDPTLRAAPLSHSAYTRTVRSQFRLTLDSALEWSLFCALFTRCHSARERSFALQAVLDEVTHETHAERIRRLRDRDSKTLLLSAAERGMSCPGCNHVYMCLMGPMTR